MEIVFKMRTKLSENEKHKPLNNEGKYEEEATN
jgi:hypothetical protein